MGFDNIHRNFPPSGEISLGEGTTTSTGSSLIHMEFDSATTSMKFKTFLARTGTIGTGAAASTYYGPYDIVSGTARGYSRTKNTTYTGLSRENDGTSATEKRCGFYDSSPSGTSLSTVYEKYPFPWFNRYGYNKNHSDFNYTLNGTSLNVMHHIGVGKGIYGGVPPTCGIDFGNGNSTLGSLKSGTTSSWSVTNADITIDQVMWMKNTATDTRGFPDLEGIVMLSMFVDHDSESSIGYSNASYVEINGQHFAVSEAVSGMNGMNGYATQGGGPGSNSYTVIAASNANQITNTKMKAYMWFCTDEVIDAMNAYSSNATHDYIKLYHSSSAPIKYNRGLYEHLDKTVENTKFDNLKLHKTSNSFLYANKNISGSGSVGSYSSNSLYHSLKLITEAINPDILLHDEDGPMQLSDYYNVPIPRYASRLTIGIVRVTSICMKSCSYSYYYGFNAARTDGGDSTDETVGYLSNQDTWDQEGNAIELDYVEFGFGSFLFATVSETLRFKNSGSEKNARGPSLGLNHLYLVDEVADKVIKRDKIAQHTSLSNSEKDAGSLSFTLFDESSSYSAISTVAGYTNIQNYKDNGRKLLMVIT